MIGNTGKFNATVPEYKRLPESVLNYNKNQKGILLLGNNQFPNLSDLLTENSKNKTIGSQLDTLNKFVGPICLVPGWADWSYGTPTGKKMVKWEYKTYREYLNNKEIHMPDWGCPGPVEVHINDSLTILLLDTQWWLHPFDTRMGKCDLDDTPNAWSNLRDALRRNQGKQVVVAGYHPIISFGEYGGYFPLAKRIFAFPITLYRKLLGTRVDLSHPDYKAFRKKLESIFDEFPNVIYASSHERNFQYIKRRNVHYIIGGSLVGGKYIKEKSLECGSRKAGYTRLDFHQDGRVELLFFPLDSPNKHLFSTILYTYKVTGTPPSLRFPGTSLPDSAIQSASEQYIVSSGTWKWMGKNYRELWAKPVQVPVFDIQKEHGGLKILRRGGGQQTHSIRLADSLDHQYSLRSLEKYVEGALPDEVHNTLAIDVVQDNISASNPYAALVVSKLSEVAGILHTNPKIVYVPEDNRLNEYKEDVANQLFLYEEHPSGDWSDTEIFGSSHEIIGTVDLLDKIKEKSNCQIDQQAVLTARLFDTFINDWDRHDDQWRWAAFKENGSTVYRPIPRDRDQAFYVNEGILPWIAARKWLMPKIQGFSPRTPNMEGLVSNARYFDRTFLSEPNWRTWELTIDSLQARLTNEQIKNAVNAFPREVQPLCAKETIEILEKRRDNLLSMARQHYLILAKNVDVVGTDLRDLFEVKRKNDLQTEVSVYRFPKDGQQEQAYYHRVFLTNETEEVRLYGLGGGDYFHLIGDVSDGIKIRIIGGAGLDTITNKSLVESQGKQTIVYDLKDDTKLLLNKDTKEHLSHNKDINQYDRMAFHYNVVSPGIFGGYNQDDGLFIGGGPIFNVYRFRRSDVHTLMANYAIKTGAFNFRYNFDSKSTNIGIDHHVDFELKAPNYAMNYFGMGNESTSNNLFDDRYYRLRVNQIMMSYAAGKRWGRTAIRKSPNGKINESELRIGGFLRRSQVEESPGHFISDLAHNGLTPEDLEKQNFVGFFGRYTYSNLDNEITPKRGYAFRGEGYQFFQLDNSSTHFFRLVADLRTYISFTKDPRSVLALRLGGTKIFGDYTFLEAAKLGGKTNLRGYLADRFYGDQAIYQNSEFRFKLFNFASYLLNGELGILAFYDTGRVWLENEDSDRWHKGYGGGFWLSPFEKTILTTTYNLSKEDQMLQFSFNFKF
ncbi:hypothetical protein SD074_16060 [Prolixibacter sp. SD074]|nr:hypothetical protein SD074_16060 [Prolixibacter sp. SD074]